MGIILILWSLKMIPKIILNTPEAVPANNDSNWINIPETEESLLPLEITTFQQPF